MSGALESPRVAAVTGASRGIGRATALALAGAGYRVIALARSESELHTLAEKAPVDGPGIVPVVLNIADESSRLAAISAVMDATDGYGIDVMVNNAGYGQIGPMEEMPLEKLRAQFEVNLFGLLAFTQPFLPGMRERRRGWIVNISSAAGRIATPFMGAYNASKFALEGMSDAMRNELAPFGVHVVLIEPGPIRANFGNVARDLAVGDHTSPYARYMRGWTGARRGANFFEGSPEDVANVIVRAVRSGRPHPRYTVTLPARLGTVARRLVPDIVIDWFLRRAMEL